MHLAESHGPGKLDPFTPVDLRSWITKQGQDGESQRRDVLIIREVMGALATEIALRPRAFTAEWRDLERILREVFERIGLTTHLTRPGKDGGLDLKLSTNDAGDHKTSLVEMKHWAEKRAAAAVLKKLVKVSMESSARSTD